MGVVYRAADEHLRRHVALKVLPPEVANDPQARARLLREARSAAALNHPSVCTIHEVGEAAGGVHIAMELVEGRTLDQWRVETHPTPAAIARVGIAIADALEHAHARGVIHRDLKPANVMMSDDGRVKVMDFGLARQLQPADDRTVTETLDALTQAGAVVGTAHYMPPEVLRGAVCDVRGDLWSFGVMMYELLAGCRPFAGQTMYQIAAAILEHPADPLPASVPDGLRAIIARCMEKDPAQRFHGAGEVRAALEQMVALGSWGAVAVPVPSGPAPRWRDRRLAAGLAGTLGIALLAALGIVGRDRIAGCRPPVPSGAIRSLAVYPLVNLSKDPDQAFFAEGMTEEIATRLAKIAALRVISRASIEGLVQQRRSLSQIGRTLRVPAILRGSVSRVADQVRISVELVRVESGDVIWAESYDRRMVDVLKLQSDVALDIAKQIKVKVTPEEHSRLKRSMQVNPQAYEAYLRGRQVLAMGMTLDGYRSAERYFKHSLDLEPGYAPAWSGLADSYYGYSSTYLTPNSVMPQAREAAKKALELDESVAEAHTSLGIVHMTYEWDWRAAEKELDRAVELKPGDADARYWRGRRLVLTGQFEEGLAEVRRSVDLDPMSSSRNIFLGWNLSLARRGPEAVALLTAACDAEPSNYLPLIFLALALELTGDHAGAVAAAEKSLQIYPNNDSFAQVAHIYGTAGRRSDALRLINLLRESRLKTFVPAGNIAYAFAGLGEADSTFHWLDLAIEDRSEILTLLKVDAGFDPVRADPRFADVLRRVGLDH